MDTLGSKAEEEKTIRKEPHGQTKKPATTGGKKPACGRREDTSYPDYCLSILSDFLSSILSAFLSSILSILSPDL